MYMNRPMPAELANARPPTRQDAAQRIRDRTPMGSHTIERFEDSLRGQQCARGMYTTMCREWGREFEQKREAAIDDALATLQHEYDLLLAQRAQIEAHNTEVLDLEIAGLRERYLETPGATEIGFEAALPDLLEERRRRAALDGQSERERMSDAMRNTIRI